MSNRICGRCRSTNVVEDGVYGGTTFYRCDTCHHLGDKEDFPEQTLFHRITASTEVLAPHLVYVSLFNACWYSTLTGDVMYKSREEAEAATVAKLEEIAG